ncbi:MAG: hypothetical protein KF898_03445 [Parachlamydiales bacterium]|nr:hypothetical protein [Verrucomicrobiota bacterium]MBX3718685.1 hypothetical protein [Candidatus Acheromyda pituitae]
MSVSATSFTPSDYQENFNPNNPYSDFFNTKGFAAGLDRTNSFYVQQSDQANQRAQEAINESFNSDSQTPVVI